jgi:hypothetical protein
MDAVAIPLWVFVLVALVVAAVVGAVIAVKFFGSAAS